MIRDVSSMMVLLVMLMETKKIEEYKKIIDAI